MDEDTLNSLRFWVQRVLVPIVVVIGVLGNFVSVVVLTRKRMRCTTHIYLTALAVADIFYLVFVFVRSLQHYPNTEKYMFYWSTYGLQHWFTDAASFTSIFLTLSFTIERYIAVCHPIRGQVLCTESRAKRVIAGVIIMCCLATITTAFEYKLENKFQNIKTGESCIPINGNASCVLYTTAQNATFGDIVDVQPTMAASSTAYARNGTYDEALLDVPVDSCVNICYIRMSDLGNNERYRDIFYMLTSVVGTFIPVALLATYNCFLVIAVHRSYRMRTQMTNTRQGDASTAQENKITITLIAVVLLFLVCQSPSAIQLIYMMRCPDITPELQAAGNICNFLVALNAACNFLLYCALSDKYRKTVKLLFLGRRRQTPHRQNTISSSYPSRYGTSQTSGNSTYNKSPNSGGGSMRNRTHSTTIANGAMPRTASANRFTISPTDYANFQAEMARQLLKTQQLAAHDFDPNHNRSSAIAMNALSPAHHAASVQHHNTPNDAVHLLRSSSLVFPESVKHMPDCKDNPHHL